ncbi:hypothetical protein HDV00_010553 [Rhizophlyctis rosea]|nr:hypothetical protein HDV00_010553 [Rhizophlyctis rosea]
MSQTSVADQIQQQLQSKLADMIRNTGQSGVNSNTNTNIELRTIQSLHTQFCTAIAQAFNSAESAYEAEKAKAIRETARAEKWKKRALEGSEGIEHLTTYQAAYFRIENAEE